MDTEGRMLTRKVFGFFVFGFFDAILIIVAADTLF